MNCKFKIGDYVRTIDSYRWCYFEGLVTNIGYTNLVKVKSNYGNEQWFYYTDLEFVYKIPCCQFKVGDYVRTTNEYECKHLPFKGIIIDIDIINLIKIINTNGDTIYALESELELICKKEFIKSWYKFKIGDMVRTCEAYNNRNLSSFKGIIYTMDTNGIWVVDRWHNRKCFNIFELEHDCDKNLKDPSYMSDEMKFLKIGNYRNCDQNVKNKQILDLVEEIKNLKDELNCERKYNNSIKEEYRINYNCYKDQIKTIESNICDLKYRTNNLVYLTIVIEIILLIMWLYTTG